MPSIPAKEAAKLDLADLEQSRQSDESAMDAILNETPVVDPNEPPPADPNNRGPNDAAIEADLAAAAAGPAKKKDDDKSGKAADDKSGKAADDKGGKKPDDEPGDKKSGDGKKTAEEEDAELESEIEQQLADLPKLPANAPEHAKEAVKAMRKALKEKQREFKKLTVDDNLTKKQRDDLQKKVDDLSQQIKDFDPDDYKDLKEMRRALAIERDPDFKKQFVKPIEDRQNDVIDILKGKNMPDSILKWITDEGGVVDFYYSKKPVLDEKTGKPILDKSGKVITQGDWFKANVMQSNALSDVERDEITDAIRDARKLMRDKDRAIAEAKKEGANWEKSQQDKWDARHKAAEGEVEKAALAEAEALGIYAQILEPKPDATDEQKTLIKKHNDRVERGAKVAQQYLKDRSPKGLGKVAVRAALSHYLMEVNTDMAGRIKDLEKELGEANDKLTRIKGAGQTSNRTGAPPASTKTVTTPPANETDEQAMERLMNEQTGGGGAKK